MSFDPVETARLYIRSFRTTDAEAFHGWRNDPVVARLTNWDCPFPMERSINFCKKMAMVEPFQRGAYYQLIIEEKLSGTAIGDIGVGYKLEDRRDAVSLGYSLSREAWGQGYLTEALEALVPLLARLLDTNRFFAVADVRNRASDAVLLKLGFSRSDMMPRNSFVKGEWCDEYHYHLELDEASN